MINFEITELAHHNQDRSLSSSDAVRIFLAWFEKNPRRLIMTYTENGLWGPGKAQFRIWDGIPANFGYGHVDSCGESLLVHAFGEQWTIREVRNRFCEELSWLRPVILPDGTILYLPLR